jgi:hypothetical protein
VSGVSLAESFGAPNVFEHFSRLEGIPEDLVQTYDHADVCLIGLAWTNHTFLAQRCACCAAERHYEPCNAQ